MKHLLILFLALTMGFEFAQAAGTVSVSRSYRAYNKGSVAKNVEVLNIDWVGDSADGSVPTKTVQMCGFVVKVITNPGAVAPTANYDIAFGDPEDSALDAVAGLLANRHTSNTEQVAPVLTGATAPIFLCGSYTVAVTNNSVNSATGRIQVYLAD